MATAAISDPAGDAKEYKIPAVLLGAGLAIYIAYGLLRNGTAGAEAMAVYMAIRIPLQVLLGLVGCFLTVRIMGASFGYVTSAVVKLAAIFVFPGAVTFFIPYVGWLIALLLYWGLLEWLFELDPLETIVLVVVIWVMSAVALLLVAGAGFAMG